MAKLLILINVLVGPRKRSCIGHEPTLADAPVMDTAPAPALRANFLKESACARSLEEILAMLCATEPPHEEITEEQLEAEFYEAYMSDCNESLLL